MIICSNEEEDTSYIINKLHCFRREFTDTLDNDDYAGYLKQHFIIQSESAASLVDDDK